MHFSCRYTSNCCICGDRGRAEYIENRDWSSRMCLFYSNIFKKNTIILLIVYVSAVDIPLVSVLSRVHWKPRWMRQNIFNYIKLYLIKLYHFDQFMNFSCRYTRCICGDRGRARHFENRDGSGKVWYPSCDHKGFGQGRWFDCVWLWLDGSKRVRIIRPFFPEWRINNLSKHFRTIEF